MIVIDSEFQSLIPPLTDDEYKGLEKSILTEGFHEWEPIVTWNGTIIDGHNRYNICDEHGIEFKQVERDFPSRDAAKIWILDHQMNRRNLSPGQRAALVIDKREAEVREQARLRQASTLKQNKKNQGTGHRLDQKVQTDHDAKEPHKPSGITADILAKEAGVGSMTIKRAIKVKRESPELYDQVRKGEIPVSAAYKRVNAKHHDADHDLRNNVAVYTIDSLKAELLASAESMKAAIKESIAINESMGVQLTSKQKKDLSAAVAHVIRTINKI